MAENGMRGGGSSDMTNGHEKDPTTTKNDNDKSASATARMNETTQKYVQDLLAERARMDNFPLAMKLIDEALERVKLTGRIPNREQYADVYQQRTIKLSQKVHVPIKDKKFNYVGKLLGPKGNSLRRLQEETQCKIVILGRFSMKDRVREEELRNSADPKYAHLNLPLHVEVSTIAPPAEAYARVAYALAQIRRYLIPDKHDDIRQEQFRELMEDPEAAKKITIRQQQQQHHQQQQHGGGGSHQYRGNGQYRPKFHQQVYHNNDETVYYRSHNNAYHQQKQYVPPSQRSNPMHAALPPQAIVGATASGMVLNAANYNGRNHLLTNSNNGLGGGVNSATGGGGAPGHMRYRPNGPYQYVKK